MSLPKRGQVAAEGLYTKAQRERRDDLLDNRAGGLSPTAIRCLFGISCFGFAVHVDGRGILARDRVHRRENAGPLHDNDHWSDLGKSGLWSVPFGPSLLLGGCC